MIEIENLSKKFAHVQALHPMSLSLARGRQLALIGPTAAGKTVFLKCLIGLYPAQGIMRIDGTAVGTAETRNHKMRARIGMLFQKNALFDSLTVWENIAHRLLHQGHSRADAYQTAVNLLHQVGLDEHVARAVPAELSGGMQKRVGFARAIASAPDIMLLDNPTAGLDTILTTLIRLMITDRARTHNTTTIIITSDMVDITKHHADIAVFHDGHLRWHGTSSAAETSDNPWLRQLLGQSRSGPIKPQVAPR